MGTIERDLMRKVGVNQKAGSGESLKETGFSCIKGYEDVY